MTERFIEADEWYPYYSLEEKGYRQNQPTHDFTDEELADYQRVMAELDAWQQRLSDLWDRHAAKRPKGPTFTYTTTAIYDDPS